MASPIKGGYIDPNRPNPNGPNDASIIIYGYTPSIALAALGIALFAINALLHGWQLVKYRTWYFTPILVGTVMEVVGYIARTLSSKLDPYHVIYFVLQYFFIVVAPVFFSAAIYTILSILIREHPHTRRFAPLPPKIILWTFITCDIIATGVQVGGAASIGKAESNRKDPKTANNVLLAGLAFQCFTFAVFILLLSIYLWRALRASKSGSGEPTFRLKPGFIPAFLVAIILIYLRTCFRLAETAEGVFGHLSTHEVFFGCLEFAPVVLAVWLFNVWHPGRCILGVNKSEQPHMAQV